ncbi:MAG: aldehyde ferredoxin oxidoreductase [Desulfobacterales bacterium]|nr:aldehyde ferredoxin oxidoreductase [Desulfobacterales bacterium]
MKILRVDMNNLTTSVEDLPDGWEAIGGRGFTSKILDREVPPNCDPLGPDNKLVIAAGPLAGTLAPSCGRISVGAKSPLTLGIKEANAGGPSGQKLDKLGFRGIIIEGKSKDSKFYVLVVNKGGCKIVSADKYLGMMNYDLVIKLRQDFSKKAAVICIGIGGERKWKSAAVDLSDIDGHCSRHAGRGGLGAVMGSKGLKAIVLDDEDTSRVDIADNDRFKNALKDWPTVLKEDKQIQGMSKYGTPAGISVLRGIGSMPALNYSSEPLEGVEAISGQTIKEINSKRGGKMEGCMPGCLVKCSIVFNDADGKHVTSAFEYETIALMGTNLGIVDPDAIAKFDRICDDLGIDTIEIGSAMGVAASAGKMKFGDAKSAFNLLDEIKNGTELGNNLGNGVVSTAKALGINRIPAVKGQAIPAHDPRFTKTTGVTYFNSPMGADHTAGISYSDPSSTEGQGERSVLSQIFYSILDTLGYCMLASPGDQKRLLSFLGELINARYNIELKTKDLVELGKETLKTELKFNKGTEFDTAHPTPDFLRTEKLAPSGQVFDIDPAEINSIWDKLDSLNPV